MSFKLAEFTLHKSSTGLTGDSSSSQQQNFRPGGRLLAFDTDGKYMLTCASNGALMYMVSYYAD